MCLWQGPRREDLNQLKTCRRCISALFQSYFSHISSPTGPDRAQVRNFFLICLFFEKIGEWKRREEWGNFSRAHTAINSSANKINRHWFSFVVFSTLGRRMEELETLETTECPDCSGPPPEFRLPPPPRPPFLTEGTFCSEAPLAELEDCVAIPVSFYSF